MLRTVSTSGGSPVLVTSGAMLAGTFYEELLQVLFDLRWLVLFIIVLVFTDFWSGLTASVKVRKEDFRLSRALRRTIVKFLEYINFIIFGLLLSKGILDPFLTDSVRKGITPNIVKDDFFHVLIVDLLEFSLIGKKEKF